jgi:tetratricopeptide (TPR) repeat protein
MSRKQHLGVSLLAVNAILLAATSTLANSPDGKREAITKIVLHIQRADYEGDRTALQHLHGELTPFLESKQFTSRVLYWRGFALWRKAINGFNDNVDKKELQQDLQQASQEFEKSASADPSFVDAKIALGSCYGLLAYSVNKTDATELQDLMAKSRQALKDAREAAPENSRLLWVLGPIYWNIPAERGGGQAKAMEAYQKGLETLRTHKTTATDPLEPSWGEPELLMNLAWSNLNRATPDLDAAEQNARAALALVPYWHYVRDILVPQIQAAKAKQNAKN